MKLTPLTEEQQQAYLQNPQRCPHCQSDNVATVESFDVGFDDNEVVQSTECRDCHRRWTDFYKLSAVGDEEECCTVCGGIFSSDDEVEYVTDDPAEDYPTGGFVHAGCVQKRKSKEAADADS